MTRVVSLTPLAVEHDSRTFKQAASLSRLGYESVLVEGTPSDLNRAALPFELLSLPAAGQGPPGGAAARSLGLLRRVAPPLRSVAALLQRHGLETAAELPEAALYYLHSLRQFPAVRLACRRNGARFIYDAHDFYPPERRETGRTDLDYRLYDRFLWRLERLAVRRAAAVITTSEGNANSIERAFGRRPEIVMNGHDPRLDEPAGGGIRAALGLDDETFLIVVPGNAKRGAAIAETIEAMAKLPGRVQLAFLGARYEPFAEMIAAAGLERRVHCLPPVRPTMFAPFIASADLALIPYFPLSESYRNAIGNRFFVPLSVGLPLIYPVGLPDLAALAREHDVGLPVDPQRSDEIVAAVERLLAEPPLLARFRDNARRAGDELSWEREEERIGRVVAAALGADGATRR